VGNCAWLRAEGHEACLSSLSEQIVTSGKSHEWKARQDNDVVYKVTRFEFDHVDLTSAADYREQGKTPVHLRRATLAHVSDATMNEWLSKLLKG
jgi:hypothetical protein